MVNQRIGNGSLGRQQGSSLTRTGPGESKEIRGEPV